MSMLAEKKRSQKWVIHQGTSSKQSDWSKDTNRFGQKLLERMGWKEGKGLGRNEDGITNHIKVAFKGNSKGIGFKDSVEWSEQQDNYKMLLEELSSTKEDAKEKLKEVKSLEEKSQNSRARLHYKKFTRGKDLSQYSEKDLANIFGKKTLTVEPVEENSVEVNEKKLDNFHGVVTVGGGCMMEYFKNKRLAKLNGVSSKSSSDLEEEITTVGFGYNNKAEEVASENSKDDNICNGATKKSKKSKDKSKEMKNTFISYVASENVNEIVPSSKQKTKEIYEEPSESLKKRKANAIETEVDTPTNKKPKFEASSDDSSKKSKKSKKKLKNKETLPDLGLTNPAFEPLGTNISIKKHVLDTITENEAESDLNETQATLSEEKHKEKRKKSKYQTELDQESKAAGENDIESNLSGMREQKKKRKDHFCAIDNPNFNISGNSEPNRTSQEHEVKPKKKKKVKGGDNPILDDSCVNVTHSEKIIVENENLESNRTVQDYELKRKKKKKSKGLDNSILNDSVLDFAEMQLQETQNEDHSVKRKKKKKSKGLDNPALNLNDSITDSQLEEIEVGDSYEVKQKKKKKSLGLDNPALNLEDSPVNSQLQEIQNGGSYEVKQKKKKKSKGLDNPALSLEDSVSELTESQVQEASNKDSYEVKHKSKKKSEGLDNPALNREDSSASLSELQKNQNDSKSLPNGIENTAMEISDCDIMLNVTDEPVKTPVTPKVDKYTPKNRSKSVRFSKTNQEYIISDRSPGDIDRRKELYDINTKVIEDGLRDLKKQKQPGYIKNIVFDIKSVDKIDFCDDGSSKSKKNVPGGIDNRAFDAAAQAMEESVKALTETINQYQAEVENSINESKIKRRQTEQFMVGELNASDGENEPHEDGVKLRFKYASFNKKEAPWVRKNDATTTLPKRSYKHLIRGDIIVGFKDSNLHKISGYGMTKTGMIN